MRKIHVMEIIAGFSVEGPSGGIAQFGINLIKCLDPDLYSRTLCGLWGYHTAPENQRIEEMNKEGIHTFAAQAWDEDKPYQSFFGSIRAINRFIENHPVDIIHSHSEFGDAAALICGWKNRVPVLMRTVHNNTIWTRRPFRRLFLVNLLYPIAFRKEIGVSQNIVDKLDQRPLAKLVKRRAALLYNSIDLSRFTQMHRPDKTQLLEKLNIHPEAVIAGSVGRLTEQKGYKYLLEAAKIILEKQPNYHFLIIGSGGSEQELKNKSRQLGIEDQVTFTGPRNDVIDLLSCMNVFVSSSLWEGLPTVIMESMAAGIPVVATDIPGTTEIITHEKNGLLVPPGNPQALAEGILKMVNSPGLAERCIKEAKESVKRFDIKTIARQHQGLYEKEFLKKVSFTAK
jgi:glycosyltransferase involved in cell wall biosynthesis